MNEAQQQQQHPQQPGGPMAQPPAYGGAGMYGAPPPVGTTGMNMQPNAPPGGRNRSPSLTTDHVVTEPWSETYPPPPFPTA